jgi:hypothetical protein
LTSRAIKIATRRLLPAMAILGVAIGVLPLSQVRADPPPLLSTYWKSDTQAITAYLSMGSDLGVVCFDITQVGFVDVGPFPTLVEAAEVAKTSTPSQRYQLGGLLSDTQPTTSGCQGGIDQAFLSDLFLHPSDYNLRVTSYFVFDPYPPETFVGPPFFVAGSQCDLAIDPQGSPTFPVPLDAEWVVAHPVVGFSITGTAFFPNSTAKISFIRGDDPANIVKVSQQIDAFGHFLRNVPVGTLKPGFWWIAVSGRGCTIRLPASASSQKPAASAIPNTAFARPNP